MKNIHGNTDTKMSDDRNEDNQTIRKSMRKVERRRAIFLTMFALTLAIVNPSLAIANDEPVVSTLRIFGHPEPVWPPKSLEQRIADASFILVGVPKEFRYLPDSAYKKYYDARDSDPQYLRLKKENASHSAFRKYFDANPGDPVEFRLRDEDEKIEGMELTYLAFDVEQVVFKRGPPDNPDMGTNGKRVYLRLGGEFRIGTPEGDRSRAPWAPYLGKRVILLSQGYLPFSDSIRLPFPEHTLATGSHSLDRFPIPLSELSRVTEIAQRLGFVRVEKLNIHNAAMGEMEVSAGSKPLCTQYGGEWKQFESRMWQGACWVNNWTQARCSSSGGMWATEHKLCQLPYSRVDIVKQCQDSGGSWGLNGANRENCYFASEERNCLAAGGSWQHLGWARYGRCIKPSKDAGKPCANSRDCESGCLAIASPEKTNISGEGRCAPNDNPFVCSGRVENGVYVQQLCAD